MKGLRRHVSSGLLALVAIANGRAIAAQEPEAHAIALPVAGVPERATDGLVEALRGLAARAGVVFVGRVERLQSSGGVMEVTFSVQQSVVGGLGDSYTLREWSGRWAAGQQHYHVGQRAMVFLYTPNQAGLSSPVDGMAGIVPLVPMGSDADPLLDVRWLATRVERPVGSPIADADFGAVALADALAVVQGSSTGPLPEPIRRPLPIGLRPHPIRTLTEETLQADPSGLPGILGQQGASDVEH